MLPFKLVLPLVGAIFLIEVFPIGYGIISSFYTTKVFPSFQTVFSGLANYKSIFQDPIYWNALLNTCKFTLATVIGSYSIGLGIALLLNQKICGRRIFRALILLPWVMPVIVISLVWRWMYNDLCGIINRILLQVGLIKSPILWLGDTKIVMYSVSITNIWKAYPFMAASLLGGLQSIPRELYEAASIDGASTLHRFIYITFPLLRPITVIIILLMTIWTFNYFDLVFLLTGGGPGHASHVLSTYAYEVAFGALNYGRGASIAVTMLIFLCFFMIIYFRVVYKRAEVE